MSLINKMLQDLDARGTPPGEAFPSQIKPVAHEPRRPNLRVIVVAVGGVLAAGALAWVGWGQLHAGRPAAPVAAAVPVAARPAAPPKAPAAMTSTITMLPAAPASPPAKQAPEGPADFIAEPEVPPVARIDAPRAPRVAHARTDAAPAKRRALVDAAMAQPVPREAASLKSVVPVEPDSEEARSARRALAQELDARQTARPAAPPSAKLPAQSSPKSSAKSKKPAAEAHAAAVQAQSREQSTSQRAESEYRRALAGMQEGRMGETIGALESALRIDPGHEAARQTLVGLLIEAHRPDDAIRQLQLGLTQDPRQPALAMLLARLQIERGGSGIETLTRTLPYAGANPDYHAFLAGALQRQQRHREAAAEYAAALRGAPANGVWWMGMGISLQAEKRNAEALEAFQKAQGSGVLSAELQAFVERQIRQLGR